MGPLAGVLLQKYIIDKTPASKDQEHLPVITYTNPQIPDRTANLIDPKLNADFVPEIIRTINVLESMGASVIGFPCNTAHSKFDQITYNSAPFVVNMVKSTLERIDNYEKIGILATDGTIASKVYEKYADGKVIVIPDSFAQKNVMETIYTIKAGGPPPLSKIYGSAKNLINKGATKIVLGCTELSTVKEFFLKEEIDFVDSLEILAEELVINALATETMPKIINQAILQDKP